MTKIIITNSLDNHALSCEQNKGSAGVAICTIKLLKDYVPNAQLASFIQFTDGFADNLGVRVIENKRFPTTRYSCRTMLESSLNLVRCMLWALVHKRCSLVAKALVNNRQLREYSSADVVIDLGLDTYSDDYGILSVVEHSKDVLLGVVLKKPVVVWAQSLGPFRSKLTSWLVKFTLNRVALITVREEMSLDHLRKLGVDAPPIHLTADPAFLLEPASGRTARGILSREGIEVTDRPLVGLTMSWSSLIGGAERPRYWQMMKEGYWAMRALLPQRLFQLMLRVASRFKHLDMSSYLDTKEIAQIADCLVEKLDAIVVLLPHDYNPVADDRVLLGEALKRVKQRDRVRLLTGDYSVQELKAVIGQCALFIGGKMHANIAALSMHVPTVAVQYSSKFHGIMRMLGQEQYICDTLTAQVVRSKVDEAWANREKIRAELEIKLESARKQASLNGELVRELLNSYAPRSGS